MSQELVRVKSAKTPGSGRKKGVPNIATRDIKALAQKHGPKAIKAIVKLAEEAENEATRLAAWNAILDRAYGKARQVVSGDDDSPPISVIHRIIIDPVGDQNGEGVPTIIEGGAVSRIARR